MEDFEKAILVVFDQGQSVSPDVRAQANTFCDAIKSRPDGWRVCWDQFLHSNCLQVKFWCLQTVPQVLAWLRDVAPSRQEEVVIRNKIALVYVWLLRTDYPAGWPTGWKDLVSLLDKGPALVDMFLRILAVFDQEASRGWGRGQAAQPDHQARHEGAGRSAPCGVLVHDPGDLQAADAPAGHRLPEG
ncbi:unnamed protein product, partial [Prorocentrum cordatum]